MIISDAREMIFPLFLVRAEGNGVYLEPRTFLGTAFFVTRRGDAVTAAHVLPGPDGIPDGQRIVAVVQTDSTPTVCWVTHSAVFPGCDFAIAHVNLDNTKYLEFCDDDVIGGTDIQLIGIPAHEVWGAGKEMRILKGHVTLVTNHLEVNFPIPAGMSGSPVLKGSKVVGFATGSVKSEEIDEYSEEVEEISDSKEIIRITKVVRMTHYGLAYPFASLRGQAPPIFDGLTLAQLLEGRNRES